MLKSEERLLGIRFSHGVVIEFAGRTNRQKRWELLWKLKCDCGKEYQASTTQLTMCVRISCGCHVSTKKLGKLPDKKNVGKTYGKLTVVDMEGNTNTSGAFYAKCLCECGRNKYVTIGNLNAGHVKSCGCEKYTGKNNKLFKGHEDISLYFWNHIRNNAMGRKIEFSITIQDGWNQWVLQNKKCALSGVDLIFGASKASRCMATASLDRINNSIGYTKENIQWVHKYVNKMKNVFDQDTFIKYCKLIADNN